MKLKERKKRAGSVGKKAGIIISIILFVILGGKTVYDSVVSYNLDVSSQTDFEREETRALSRNIEGRFKKAY